MIIAGLQKQSLIEYPGRISAVIFLAGCNLRCQFCFTARNKIFTDKGLVSIEKVVKNPKNYLVYDFAGKFSPIKKCFIRKTDEILQIKTFWRSDLIETTPNHEFLIFDIKQKKFLKKRASQLNPDNDFLTITIPQGEIKKYKMDINPAITTLYQILKTRPRFSDKNLFQKVENLRKKGYSWRKIYKILNVSDHIRRILFKKDYLDSKILPPLITLPDGKIRIKGGKFSLPRFIEITPKFMKLVGYYLAEGCVSKNKKRKNSYYLSFTFNENERNFIEEVKDIFYDIFRVKLSEVKNKKSKTIQLTCAKGIIGIFFKYYFGGNSLDKKLPLDFLFLQKEFQKELIKGLFFGDGVTLLRFLKKYQCQRLSCCSETLKYQISLILYRLGIRHSILKEEISIKDRKIFSLLDQEKYITKRPINVGWRYGFLDEKYVYLKIQRIKKIKKPQIVYNLEIDNPTHSYNVFLVNVSNCYVPNLVLPKKIKKIKPIPEKEIFSFLKERKNFLEAVAITGGEPTLNKELPEFIKKIKKLGYLVELETNGTNSRMLKSLIQKKLVDYVAMDIKNNLIFEKYNEICGKVLTKKLFTEIQKSIKILISGKIDYEFRTTIMKEFHKKEDILAICEKIKGAKIYYLQNYQKNETISKKVFTPFAEKEIQDIVKEGQKFVNVKFRKYL